MDEKIIIQEIQSGNSDNFSIILSNYRRMMYSIVNHFSRSYGDYLISEEDLFQEASIGLYDACLKYKEDRGSKFSSFAYLVIKRRLYTKYKFYYHTYVNENKSLDEMDGMYDVISYSNYISETSYRYGENSLTDSIHNYYESLPQLEKEIINLRADKLSYKEIGERLNISAKIVDNKIYRIRKLLNKYLDNNHYQK